MRPGGACDVSETPNTETDAPATESDAPSKVGRGAVDMAEPEQDK